MSNLELKNIDDKPNNESTKDLHDFEVFEIPQELKDLQELTKISDQHVQKLIKTYKDELVTSPLLLWLEAYYGEIKDTKSLENLIDKVSEKKLTADEMVKYIVEDCLNVRTTKKDLADLNTNIDYESKQSELYDKIKELESKNFDKLTLDHDSRNKSLESIKDPAEKLVVSYISTKDIPLPDAEAEAKNIQATTNDEKIKKLSVRELIEQKDRVPWSIIKDLNLPPEQAKAIKELNYKTFIQILQSNHTLIAPELIIDAVKHEKSTDKIQDKIIQKGVLTGTARDKYGSKIAKAVVNYSIDQVFGNSLFKKSAAAKEIKTELDVANLLAHYITSWKVEKIPKPIIDKNQGYTDSRVALKSKTESSNQEEAKKQNEAEIEQTRIDLLHITDQKEAAEDRDLQDIIATIDDITWGFDVDKIVSKWFERDKKTGTTLCSRTACLNINNIIKLFGKDDDPDALKWDASSLIKDLIKSQVADIIKPTSFTDPTQIEYITKYFKNKALESQGNVFDVYTFSPNRDRFVVFLASDGNLYALSPYYGGGKTTKPVPLEQLLKNLAPKVQSTNIVVNNIVYAQISDVSQKRLAEAYKKLENNYSLQTKLEQYYGDEDIVQKLSQYDDEPYHDGNITELPSTNIDTPKQPEAIQEDFTLAMLQLHVPKIYGDITYDELYTAITSISDPSLKTKCIQTIKAEKIMDFQLLLGMLKNAPLENKADGKIGQYTLNKIKEKINNNATSIAEHNQNN